jgi:hypothetical protein
MLRPLSHKEDILDVGGIGGDCLLWRSPRIAPVTAADASSQSMFHKEVELEVGEIEGDH